MNDIEPLEAPAVAPATTSLPPRTYAPKFTLYHQNAKGTGSALSIEVRPATSERDGALFAALAPQKTAAANGSAASFAWNEKVTVKLDFSDICQILMVLTRRADALGNNGKGLLHEGATARTFISLSRKDEAPWTGFLLEFSRKAKTADESTQPVRYRILLTDPEAYGLSLLLQQQLSPLVFGR